MVAADRLFYEKGIHQVGVDQVSQEAGISKASLYTHFRTKDDLVVTYLSGRSQAWQRYVADELPHRADAPQDKIVAIFDLLGEWFAAPDYRGCPFINAEAEFGTDHASHEVTLAHRAWVRELFTGLLVEASVDDPELVALELCVLYDGAMASAQADPSKPWAAAAARAARRAL